jgi:hypothetical protein
VRIRDGDTSYGPVHNEWNDRVRAPTRLLRSADLDARINAAGYILYLAFSNPDQYVTFAVVAAIEDVERWLEDWLNQAAPRQACVPQMEQIRQLVHPTAGQVEIVPLNDRIQQRRRPVTLGPVWAHGCHRSPYLGK